MAFIEVERLIVTSSWKMQNPHKHSHYEIYFLQEGMREHIIDGRVYYAASHSFVLIPPNTPHQTEGTPFNRLNINFDAEYVSILPADLLAHCFQSTLIPISQEDLPVFSRIVEQIEKEYEYSVGNDDQLLKLMVGELIILLDRYAKEHAVAVSASLEGSAVFSKVLHYVDHQFITCTLSEVANTFFLSTAHLSRQFHRFTGMTFSRYILNKKVAKAMYLLKHTQLDMGEIAAKCGFLSANYFSMRFKKIVGLSPLNYRQAHDVKRI
ncbi:MAG: AraC family transcriptional regulator [Clostridiaceae bacterium]